MARSGANSSQLVQLFLPSARRKYIPVIQNKRRDPILIESILGSQKKHFSWKLAPFSRLLREHPDPRPCEDRR
jgi:hypothetical protein